MLLSFAAILTSIKQVFILVSYVTSTNSFPQPLSAEEETEFLEKYRKGKDDARNILIERNLRLVAHVAKKYSYLGKDNDDLISIGTIGLIKAVTTFNQDKGTRLATYAARCIENAILTQWLKLWRKMENKLLFVKNGDLFATWEKTWL